MELRKTEGLIPEISIIVPVYNMERYLHESLDSIKGQSFSNWECIIIDDGSTDASPEICEEYAVDDPRFKVFHTSNRGVAEARNLGLKEACGRYIGSVDPDDICHPDMYSHLYELITRYNADVSAISCLYLFKTFKRRKRYVRKIEVFECEDIAKTFIENRLPCYMCNKLFKRSVINSSFPTSKVFEDIYVIAQWVKDIRRLVVSPQPLYFYRKRANSITNSGSNLSFQSNFSSSRRFLIKTLCSLYPDAVSQNRINYLLLNQIISASKTLARNISSIDDAVKAVKSISEENIDIPMMSRHDLGMKKWLRIKLIRKYPRVFVHLMRITHVLDFHQRFVTKQLFS